MVIDFHTHVFPDDLAPKAIFELASNINNIYTPVSDGTVSGLLTRMDEWNIDVSVLQPVITKQSQFRKTNEWIASLVSDRLIGFGGVFPYTDDYKRDINFVVSLGLKGLKFHGEYQDFFVDDELMLKIYDYALSKGLILLFHAGSDPAFPPPVKGSPQRLANVVKAMSGGIIVAAHLGGEYQWDDVETHLAGGPVYLDTSMGFEHFSHDQFLRILKKHGSEKILFASDSPWSNAKTEIEHLQALALPPQDMDAILAGNAKRVLKISSLSP